MSLILNLSQNKESDCIWITFCGHNLCQGIIKDLYTIYKNCIIKDLNTIYKNCIIKDLNTIYNKLYK